MAGPVAHWQSEKVRLDAQLAAWDKKVADLARSGAAPEQIAQARLNELAAVKQYNDFVDTAITTTATQSGIPGTARGILGSAIDSGKSVFSAGLEWITPSNATNQLACAGGFNSLVGAVTGKVLSNPGGAANPAAEKALEEIGGQGKGGVMKPGDAIPIGIAC
ncbi:hypothetical protein [Cupriavidus alkaliphilus]|uniref:hypothetical protein n=1 Tax=Cupriavidus alkaliphilus TaxID=942866 RepID=UPI0011BDC6F3|nr:hypothetical protein [Cupriavidus alkaliphilus]MBB2919758.1 hypothetical protein [Cupriavidus alkaliphilus]MBB3014959.1 hypothetical protein [Cupriavidus alkaliphilus]